MRMFSLLAAAVAAVALTGCETQIDDKKAEELITDSVTDQVQAQVKSVSCPSGLTAKKGGRFQCTVTGADGSIGQANVTMTDDKGNVRVRAPFVNPQTFASNVSDALVRGEGISADALKVTCPQIIAAKADGELQCAANDGREDFKVDLKLIDGQAHFNYRIVQ